MKTKKIIKKNKLLIRFKVCNCVKEGKTSLKTREPSSPMLFPQKEKTYKKKCIQFFVTYSKFQTKK